MSSYKNSPEFDSTKNHLIVTWKFTDMVPNKMILMKKNKV